MGITNCLSDDLGACTCLSDMYTSRTHLVHVFCIYTQDSVIFVAYFVNLRSVSTHVHVVYMFDKHVHAFNSLNINMITGVFMGRVRV